MNSAGVQLLAGKWLSTFEAWVDTVQASALLVSPFVARSPIEMLVTKWTGRGIINSVKVRLIVDLSPKNVLQGSLEPAALLGLVQAIPHSSVVHLRSLHAKVYVADDSTAIITSGNLTKSGLDGNFEYGVCLTQPSLVRQIRNDFDDVETIASPVLASSLQEWVNAANDLRPLQRKAERGTNREILTEFRRRVEEAELEVMRIRARGETDNSIYSRTILYLLKRYGPLTTEQMHPLIQSLHPDLCDDSIDRVIDSVHFGKRWKHMVRNAQQYLKRQGKVAFDGHRWVLSPLN